MDESNDVIHLSKGVIQSSRLGFEYCSHTKAPPKLNCGSSCTYESLLLRRSPNRRDNRHCTVPNGIRRVSCQVSEDRW